MGQVHEGRFLPSSRVGISKCDEDYSFTYATFARGIAWWGRYMRGMRLRWPLKKLTNGRPIDLINFEQKAALLAGGYALVTIDVRGTGMYWHSHPRLPWACGPMICRPSMQLQSREEHHELLAML